MAPSNRWRAAKRIAFAGAGQAATPLYTPPGSNDVLNVRQLTISTDAAAELVVYFGDAAADRTSGDNAVRGVFLPANGGAAPDLGCEGAWAPSGGKKLQVFASAACNVWIEAEGLIE